MKLVSFNYLLPATLTLSIAYWAAIRWQSYFILHPTRLAKTHQFEFEHDQDFEELFFKNTAKNLYINAIYFKTKLIPSNGLVFYLHGNAGNIQKSGQLATDFTNIGYDVLMIDYRGFGKSQGHCTSAEQMHEDVQWIYEQVLQMYAYNEDEIIVYGRSLGSGMATKLAADNKPKSLVLETPFCSVADVAQKYIKILPLRFWEKKLRFNFENNRQVPDIQCPIYIFQGTKDKIVPYHSAEKLKPLLSEKSYFVTIEGGNHHNLRDFLEYNHYLNHFLNEQESLVPPQLISN